MGNFIFFFHFSDYPEKNGRFLNGDGKKFMTKKI